MGGMAMIEFKCAMCHEYFLIDHCAFTFEVEDDMHEGVCGWCALGEEQ
jgi:hypothetical protein